MYNTFFIIDAQLSNNKHSVEKLKYWSLQYSFIFCQILTRPVSRKNNRTTTSNSKSISLMHKNGITSCLSTGTENGIKSSLSMKTINTETRCELQLNNVSNLDMSYFKTRVHLIWPRLLRRYWGVLKFLCRISWNVRCTWFN